MKKIILAIVFLLIGTFCKGQEWFTSFDVAKRLALVQDKLLFVIWEDSFKTKIPIYIKADKGPASFVDLAKVTSYDPIIWEYFVPVRLSEDKFEEFRNIARGRGLRYMDKLMDNSIKIMDVNGNILNVSEPSGDFINFYALINKYAISTSYLKVELSNYLDHKEFLTSILLASRYIDFAIFNKDDLRPEIIELGDIYLDEAKDFIPTTEEDKRNAFNQRIELLKIKELVILNQLRKAHRRLKRIDQEAVDTINQSLFAFLNYALNKLLHDEVNADVWKSNISSLDLKKVEIILKSNTNGSTN